MKFWTLSTLCTASLLILNGCVASPTPPEELKIDSSLPMVKLTQNGLIVDMKTVAFEWTSVKDPRVQGVYVYKESFTPENGSQFEYYATIPSRFQTHYLDKNVEPDSRYNYRFRTFSKDAHGVESKTVPVNTLPVLSSVSWIHSITGMPRSAKIIWRPHTNERVNSYIIERKTLEEEEWKKIDTIMGRLNAEYIDAELDDNYVYIYRIRAVTFDDIVSTPSEGVKVVTKALPRAVVNIKTTNNLAKKIQISWDASTQEDFELYHVYKSKNMDGGYELIAKLSKDAHGVESKTVPVNTLPVLSSVSWIHSITGMPRSAKIIWRPHTNERVNSYIIERKTLEEEEWKKIDTIVGRLNAEYIDAELDDNYVYIYRIRAVTYDDIVSTPSEGVKVVTKALPRAVVNIKTTNNLAKKIQISWDASTQEDFELYHVYKSKNMDGGYELIAKLHNSNSFIDNIDEDGKSYFYRVSVIDKDGLESEHEKNSIHGMTLPKPSAPGIVEAKLTKLTIELIWSKADPRARSFIVEKSETKGWFDKTSETYEGITSQHFSDKNILPNSKYLYTVYSVDKDGVKSEPSIEVKIETPESTEIESTPVKKRADKEVKIAPRSDKKQEVISPAENLDLNEI